MLPLYPEDGNRASLEIQQGRDTVMTSPTPPPTTSPLLLGIVIDVSSSMRRNWRNQDGKKLPRIEVVRDALNKRIREKQNSFYNQKDTNNEIEIFCLGMGFQTIVHWTDVDISYEKEHSLGNAAAKKRAVDLVCDLIALGEILPNKEKLINFKEQLNQRWLHFSKDILDRSTIVDDVYAQLVEYLQVALYESAMKKIHSRFIYKLSRIQRFNNLFPFLQDIIKEQEENITVTSKRAAIDYADDVFNKTNKDFKANTAKYISLIRQHLHEFAQSYTASTLNALTLGFEIEELVDDLDEHRIIALAKQIHSDLERDVRNHIKLALVFHAQKLFAASRSIAASLDHKKIRQLTEHFIRKFGWDILRSLIEETVLTIFSEQFEMQAKENFPYWIRLTSAREVVRPLSQLSTLLPDSIEAHVYSDQVMFGSTPFVQALDKAAIRLIDRAYSNRRKILIIISDGEFEQVPAVMVTTNLLKRRGVTIISCLISDRNLLSRLIRRSPETWPLGAQRMVEISSSVSEQSNTGIHWQSDAYHLTDEKLCLQMNHSSILEDVLEAVLDSDARLDDA
jgi:hypothetical protein